MIGQFHPVNKNKIGKPHKLLNSLICLSDFATQSQVKRKLNSVTPSPIKNSDFPPSTYTKGKWKPPAPGKQSQAKHPSSSKTLIPKRGSLIQYWCGPCNRRLASKVVYERHLRSELHLKRTLQDTEFEDRIAATPRFQIERPKEPAAVVTSYKEEVNKSKRQRRKLFIRCEVCRSRVNHKMLGKHLISHYHCRKGDITLPEAQKMVLDNIHDIVLQSPFQCAACKFYCNTQEEFLFHWKSEFHIEKTSHENGFFLCTFCNYQACRNDEMLQHLTSSEHEEVIAVINRSVPIQIRRIIPIECETCKEQFVLNIQLRKHCEEVGHVFTGRKTDEHNCKVCNRYFRSFDSLAKHQRRKHRKKVYVCGLCSVSFDSPSEIVKHRRSADHRYVYLEKKKRKLGIEASAKRCRHCAEEFSGFSALKTHLKEKHPESAIRYRIMNLV